jgi:hypothetical protein
VAGLALLSFLDLYFLLASCNRNFFDTNFQFLIFEYNSAEPHNIMSSRNLAGPYYRRVSQAQKLLMRQHTNFRWLVGLDGQNHTLAEFK